MFSNINTTLGRSPLGRRTINKLSTSTQICSSPNTSQDWRGAKICNPDPARAFSYQILGPAPREALSLIGRLLWSGLWLVGSRLQWHSKVYYSIAIPACPPVLHHTYSPVEKYCWKIQSQIYSWKLQWQIQLKNTAKIYSGILVILQHHYPSMSYPLHACIMSFVDNPTSVQLWNEKICLKGVRSYNTIYMLEVLQELSTSPMVTLPPWPGLAKVQRKRLVLYQFISTSWSRS